MLTDMVFDKAWFIKHQQILRWFANTWIGRYVICINGNKSSVGKNKIIRIEPNTIFWKGQGKKIVAEFRSHDKFSKRIFYAFYPLWRLLHFWDLVIANRFIPSLNLGFDTLTAYPDAGSGATTVDGYAAHALNSDFGVAWATLIAAAGNDALADGASLYGTDILADTAGNDNEWKYCLRNKMTFDTSSLTNPASISAATLSIFGVSKTDALSIAPTANIYSVGGGANAMAASDYATFGSTAFCDTAITYANWSTTDYMNWVLNASGRGNINKTGVSFFGLRNANYDVAEVAPAWTANSETLMIGYSADQAGTTNDPKLVVTYVLTGSYMGKQW